MNAREIEQFLYREARLMDEHRYHDWLSLWADDALYWVPSSNGDIDPSRKVSIIYDDRGKIEDRISYLEGGTLLDADSRPSLRRVLSNIESSQIDDGAVEVSSNFILVEARGHQQNLWAGRSIHRLRPEGEAMKIFFKKVLLANGAQPLPIMLFLI